MPSSAGRLNSAHRGAASPTPCFFALKCCSVTGATHSVWTAVVALFPFEAGPPEVKELVCRSTVPQVQIHPIHLISSSIYYIFFFFFFSQSLTFNHLYGCLLRFLFIIKHILFSPFVVFHLSEPGHQPQILGPESPPPHSATVNAGMVRQLGSTRNHRFFPEKASHQLR